MAAVVVVEVRIVVCQDCGDGDDLGDRCGDVKRAEGRVTAATNAGRTRREGGQKGEGGEQLGHTALVCSYCANLGASPLEQISGVCGREPAS